MSCAQSTPAFSQLPDLVCQDLGGKVLFATDEWFASADCLLQMEDPVWKEGEFTSFGKWMDGWESRRRRTLGHDWAIIKLGVPGIVRGILLDTAFFTGNQVPHASVMGTFVADDADIVPKKLRSQGKMGTCATEVQIAEVEKVIANVEWFELLGQSPLGPGYEETRYNYFEVKGSKPITHLRLNYFPDGGVARFRLYGEVVPRPLKSPSETLDVLSALNGGMALCWSNDHYGVPTNLCLPGKSRNMGCGWETARNPNRPKVLQKGFDDQIEFGAGRDWAVFKLCFRSHIESALIDTDHFKGNYPESAVLEAIDRPDLLSRDIFEQQQVLADENIEWQVVLERTKLKPHCEQKFVLKQMTCTHMRLTILPDGGVARLRIYGKQALPSHAAKL